MAVSKQRCSRKSIELGWDRSENDQECGVIIQQLPGLVDGNSTTILPTYGKS